MSASSLDKKNSRTKRPDPVAALRFPQESADADPAAVASKIQGLLTLAQDLDAVLREQAGRLELLTLQRDHAQESADSLRNALERSQSELRAVEDRFRLQAMTELREMEIKIRLEIIESLRTEYERDVAHERRAREEERARHQAHASELQARLDQATLETFRADEALQKKSDLLAQSREQLAALEKSREQLMDVQQALTRKVESLQLEGAQLQKDMTALSSNLATTLSANAAETGAANTLRTELVEQKRESADALARQAEETARLRDLNESVIDLLKKERDEWAQRDAYWKRRAEAAEAESAQTP